MSLVPPQLLTEFAAFPEVLQNLVEAELAAGNSIEEISSGFPASPVGACLKLSRNITTRPRESSGGIDFYERNTPQYLSEITDDKRFYFVLEPPGPPEPEPDMNAIRAKMEADYAASMAEKFPELFAGKYDRPTDTEYRSIRTESADLSRFRESMNIDYDRWREGTSYNLEVLRSSNAADRQEIEQLLTAGPARDWRDVEALAELGTAKARARLREVLGGSDHRLTMAVLQYAPEIVSKKERIRALVAALEGSEIFTGLSEALEIVQEFHPPEIISALLRGARHAPGERSVHFAAMLFYLHGKAESAFDWNHRPFFLRFHATDRAERETLFRELCSRIGIPVPRE